MDWTARQPRAVTGPSTVTGNGAPRRHSVSTPGHSTLWQDLKAVRDSGVLEQLTAQQCKYQEVSEASGGWGPRWLFHQHF